MIHIKTAETKEEIQGILSLQEQNFKINLTPNEIEREGFVTVNHDLETLQLMNSYEPQIIAVEHGIVVGYALVMTRQLEDKIPVLQPMFQKLNELSFESKLISKSRFYIMGQVCIAKAYRGKGLFAELYNKHKTEFSNRYDYCITEVSDSNPRSMKAHLKIGFKNIHSFTDDTDTWNILLWNLNPYSI